MKVRYALFGALIFSSGLVVGAREGGTTSPGAVGAVAAHGHADADCDRDSSRALEQLQHLQSLRDLARAKDLEAKEQHLLGLLVTALAERRDSEARGLLDCCGAGEGELADSVVAALLDAARGAHEAELRSHLLDFLASRVERSKLAPLVVELCQSEKDVRVRATAVKDLGVLIDPGHADIAVLAKATRDPHPAVRLAAVSALAPLASREKVTDQLLAATEREPSPAARRLMLEAVASIEDPRVQPLLWKVLETSQPLEVKLAALEHLAPEGDDARFGARLAALKTGAQSRGESSRLIEAIGLKIVNPADGAAPVQGG